MAKLTINQAMELDYKTSEAFKILRTNLEHKDEVKVISFTSVIGKEGKSFVAFHTAKAMAATGKKCIYINGNLREKEHNDIYSIEGQAKGLSEYLARECRIEDIISETNVFNLSILEAGGKTESSSEVLGKKEYKELIGSLREAYDYIFIDTPAIGEVADGLTLAHSSDGVILVIEPNMVNYEEAQKVKGLLEVNGCNIVGVVMNKK